VTGHLSWDDPEADPLADIQELLRQELNRPWCPPFVPAVHDHGNGVIELHFPDGMVAKLDWTKPEE